VLHFPTDLTEALSSGQINLQEAAQLARRPAVFIPLTRFRIIIFTEHAATSSAQISPLPSFYSDH